MLLGRQRIESLLWNTCGKVVSKGLHGLVRWVSSREETMRSALDNVTYAASGEDSSLVITLLGADRKAASVATGEVSSAAIDRAIEAAAEMLPFVPSNPHLPDLLGAEDTAYGDIADAYDRETAAGALEMKADFFSQAHRMALLAGFHASGRFFTAEGEAAAATTKGLLRYHPFTLASCHLVVSGEGPDGRFISAHAAESGIAVRRIDGARIIDEALTSARLQAKLPFANPFAKGASELRFDAILSPSAMQEWLLWLSLFGLGGLSVVERASCLTGKIGERVTGERFTLVDDWTRTLMPPLPFDSEGRDRQVVRLIERGIARGVVWDGATAKKACLAAGGRDTVSTGHANEMPFGDELEANALPLHLVMEGGSATPERMVKDAARPTILVSYLNYPGMPDPREAVFTATTRHDTFLIEGGEYVAALPPLRIQEKTLEAFSRIEALSAPELVVPFENYGGVVPMGTLVPWTKIADLAFIGAVA